ncbi:substrate-binding domain-containing protein [Nostoc sp. 106C]|uniref:substrate-binding domain-containing protein n=1 Tax=Nostoc sp. 106C TaxID=1932667 RepID=UPI000A3B064F|nr:substrate-binding domain-containing protein [Nostoc sp. 106C]OUL27928.1 phosphate ABC transporter substrate-binding protein [Nostoc sp. RF31YmG]OUL33171.1 phosphate ABC transporter substrate-binding protein [Nostoc sp. 106C]
MTNDSKKSVPLSQDAVQMIRGLIIGELVTVAIIGGLWLWLRPRLQVDNGAFASSGQGAATTSALAASNFKTVTNVPIGSFNYGGSTAWAPIRQLVDSQIQITRPELQLRYVNPTTTSPGSGSGIRMLLDGKLDFAESSRPLTDEEKDIARQRGFILEERQVGIDGVAVVVNPALKVPGLTVDQLQQIYLGQITNWKQVGGPDLAIAPLSQHPENADVVLISGKQVLDEQALGSNVQYVYSTTEALRRVNQTPGGLYYASARGVVHQCMVKALPLGLTSTQLTPPYQEPFIPLNECPQKRNQLNTEAIKNGSYPMTSKLFVVIKQNKGKEQQVGEAYLRLLATEQGQKAIEQAGLVAERSHEPIARGQVNLK